MEGYLKKSCDELEIIRTNQIGIGLLKNDEQNDSSLTDYDTFENKCITAKESIYDDDAFCFLEAFRWITDAFCEISNNYSSFFLSSSLIIDVVDFIDNTQDNGIKIPFVAEAIINLTCNCYEFVESLYVHHKQEVIILLSLDQEISDMQSISLLPIVYNLSNYIGIPELCNVSVINYYSLVTKSHNRNIVSEQFSFALIGILRENPITEPSVLDSLISSFTSMVLKRTNSCSLYNVSWCIYYIFKTGFEHNYKNEKCTNCYLKTQFIETLFTFLEMDDHYVKVALYAFSFIFCINTCDLLLDVLESINISAFLLFLDSENQTIVSMALVLLNNYALSGKTCMDALLSRSIISILYELISKCSFNVTKNSYFLLSSLLYHSVPLNYELFNEEIITNLIEGLAISDEDLQTSISKSLLYKYDDIDTIDKCMLNSDNLNMVTTLSDDPSCSSELFEFVNHIQVRLQQNRISQ